jgi:hypothetical protein
VSIFAVMLANIDYGLALGLVLANFAWVPSCMLLYSAAKPAKVPVKGP